MKTITQSLHVVPKADIDKMFVLLKADFPANSLRMQQLRGLAYANTFLAHRTILTEDAAAGGGATDEKRPVGKKKRTPP